MNGGENGSFAKKQIITFIYNICQEKPYRIKSIVLCHNYNWKQYNIKEAKHMLAQEWIKKGHIQWNITSFSLDNGHESFSMLKLHLFAACSFRLVILWLYK